LWGVGPPETQLQYHPELSPEEPGYLTSGQPEESPETRLRPKHAYFTGRKEDNPIRNAAIKYGPKVGHAIARGAVRAGKKIKGAFSR
jgi:hypothetical protein